MRRGDRLGSGSLVVVRSRKSLQSWQNPGLKGVLAKCKTPPAPFSIPDAGQSANANAAPPDPALPAPAAIPGMLAAAQAWKGYTGRAK